MFNIKGVDISNNNSISDLTTLKNNGVEYIYLKATEGATFKDKATLSRVTQSENLNLKVGFYHFLVGTSTPESQAENFYEYINDFKSSLVPMLDVETNFSGLCNYVTRFIAHFKKISNMTIGIYTYSGFIDNLNSIASEIADLPCWIANYRKDYEGVNTGFFTNIVGWQYSENGTIGWFTGDCNMFNTGCLLNKKYYVVTNYLPNSYEGYDGVDIKHVLSYFKDVKCYVRGNEKGVWIETQYLPIDKCNELKEVLGSWFYEIKED